jgi:hypothetical protein
MAFRLSRNGGPGDLRPVPPIVLLAAGRLALPGSAAVRPAPAPTKHRDAAIRATGPGEEAGTGGAHRDPCSRRHTRDRHRAEQNLAWMRSATTNWPHSAKFSQCDRPQVGGSMYHSAP